MFLSHPLSFSNPPISPERLEELTKSVRDNRLTRQEEEELNNGYISLVLSLAQKWSRNTPHLSDIFVADGLNAVFTGIRKAPEKLRPDKTLTQYLVARIRSAFLNARRKDPMFRVRKVCNKKESLVKLTRHCTSVLDQLPSRQDRVELREVISMAPRNVFEQAVLEMKKFGYTNKEIAEQLTVSPSEISNTLGRLEERLRQLLS